MHLQKKTMSDLRTYFRIRTDLPSVSAALYIFACIYIHIYVYMYIYICIYIWISDGYVRGRQ